MAGNMARLPEFGFTYPIGALWELNESIFVKHLKWSLAHYVYYNSVYETEIEKKIEGDPRKKNKTWASFMPLIISENC